MFYLECTLCVYGKQNVDGKWLICCLILFSIILRLILTGRNKILDTKCSFIVNLKAIVGQFSVY